MGHPPAAYRATRGSALSVDRAFYQRIAEGAREEIARHRLPIRDGLAWRVPAGCVTRISAPEGAQVGDLNVWNAADPEEHLWAARTRQLQAAHVSTFDRLWSTLPSLRPLATIVADSLEGYGQDAEGGRVHDLLGSRCDPYVHAMLTGEQVDHCCHSNLVRAVHPFGLEERHVHDVLNVFQCTGLNDEDQYFMKASPAEAGDHLELFAEVDLLLALSTCPGGDLSVPLWGPDAVDPIDVCRPLEVRVYELDPALLEGWSPPAKAPYRGNHGLR